jgi:hypothetical protein
MQPILLSESYRWNHHKRRDSFFRDKNSGRGNIKKTEALLRKNHFFLDCQSLLC